MYADDKRRAAVLPHGAAGQPEWSPASQGNHGQAQVGKTASQGNQLK